MTQPVDTRELRECICSTCGGQGWVVEEFVYAEACGACGGNGCGLCSDGAIPAQGQRQAQCPDCNGEGLNYEHIRHNAQLFVYAADELDALRARVTELEAQLRKSEMWGKEMKRQANEQANLANTWMNRRLAMQDELARICYERDELRSGNDNLQLQVTDLQQQLAETRERATEQYDLLQLATLNGWNFVPDWSDAATGRICMDVGHTVFSPPADDYSQAVKTAIKYVLDDGRDEIEDYNGIVAAIEAAIEAERGKKNGH